MLQFEGSMGPFWPWHECVKDSNQTILHNPEWWWQISITSLVAESSAVRKIIWWTNIHRDFQPSLWPWSWRQQSTLFCTTLRLTRMHHNAKFGSKRFSISEDMEQTAFIYDLNYHCDTDLKDRSLNLYCTTLWLLMMHHHTLFCGVCGSKIQQFQNTPPPSKRLLVF